MKTDRFPNLWYEFRFPSDLVAKGIHSEFLREIEESSIIVIKHDPLLLEKLIVLGIPQADMTSNYAIPNRDDIIFLKGFVEKWSEYKISDDRHINDYSACALLFGDQLLFEKLKNE